MGDGKALQMATSHELGQNFATAFDITYTDSSGKVQTTWTTSWGSSTRMMGGLFMSHGDDSGLRIPPRIAPHQVVVIAVKDDDRTVDAAKRIVADLAAVGVRAKLDARVTPGFGRRATEWELKGVPLRVEVGPRDLDAARVTCARRDAEGKSTLSLADLASTIPALLEQMQDDMLANARTRLAERTTQVSTIEEAREAAKTGFAVIDWAALGEAGEKELNKDAITVRCLQTRDGQMPDPLKPEQDLVAIVARSY